MYKVDYLVTDNNHLSVTSSCYFTTNSLREVIQEIKNTRPPINIDRINIYKTNSNKGYDLVKVMVVINGRVF